MKDKSKRRIDTSEDGRQGGGKDKTLRTKQNVNEGRQDTKKDRK